MTIAVYINTESDAHGLIAWGIEIAAADRRQLLIVIPRRTKGKQSLDSIAPDSSEKSPLAGAVARSLGSGAEPDDSGGVIVDTKEMSASDPAAAFAELVESLTITLLLLPAHRPSKSGDVDDSWHQRLFTHAPCETMIVNGLPRCQADAIRILIASDDENDPNTVIALARGCQLAQSKERGSITLLFVRPDDDLVADQVAQRHLDKLAGRVPRAGIDLQQKFQLADSLIEGIMLQRLEDFDIVFVGTAKRRTLIQVLRQTKKFDETETSLAVVRKSVPVSHRLWNRFTASVRSQVPQINRDERITVVDRLQNSSMFDFDFVALISLSTLIAALGLVRNSGAVVIGAMLVAPLMTPLVAIGFSLVQANEQLIRRAVKSVLLGFTVALGIAVIVGLMLRLFSPNVGFTPEMFARGAPNFLDLVVALASGVAGAYAMGRAHLVSAIPGVAIAAALVPPIATSGLSLSMGNWKLCGGSLLLFATNIIAIVLGTAITFWGIGINSRDEKKKAEGSQRPPLMWPRYVFLGLVILSLILATEMHYYNPVNGNGETP
jgi:uncharacterized hydrophobic protein (TIGR00271 family)